MDESKDFIVSELLSELKKENERKDAQIKTLHRTIARISIAALIAVLIVIGACLLYLNQYDYTSSDTLNIEKSAEGMIAMVDSDGNVVGYDEPVLDNGESNVPSNPNEN